MHSSRPPSPLALPGTKKRVFLDEMRKITKRATEQESRLRADLREVQRKLDAEEKYAQKVKEEREDLRQVVKRQKIELGSMDEKVKAMEAEKGRQAEELVKFKQHWTDTIQRAVEKCTRKYVDNLDSCFPGGTYEFSCDEHDAPAESQAEGSSQKSKEETHGKMEADGVVENDDSVSVNSKN